MTELDTMKRAKMYMDKLAQGIDPISGQEIPEDSVLNQVRLARCFFYVSGVLDQVIGNGGQVGSKPKRVEFSLTPEQYASLQVSAYPVRISEFAELLHRAADNPEMRKPSTTVITNWLLEKGFLVKESGPDGKPRRVPTEQGRRIGMRTETRQGQYGEYTAVYYSTEAQRFLVDHLREILGEKS